MRAQPRFDNTRTWAPRQPRPVIVMGREGGEVVVAVDGTIRRVSEARAAELTKQHRRRRLLQETVSLDPEGARAALEIERTSCKCGCCCAR